MGGQAERRASALPHWATWMCRHRARSSWVVGMGCRDIAEGPPELHTVQIQVHPLSSPRMLARTRPSRDVPSNGSGAEEQRVAWCLGACSHARATRGSWAASPPWEGPGTWPGRAPAGRPSTPSMGSKPTEAPSARALEPRKTAKRSGRSTSPKAIPLRRSRRTRGRNTVCLCPFPPALEDTALANERSGEIAVPRRVAQNGMLAATP